MGLLRSRRRPATAVLQEVDPRDWREHRFGLSAARWSSLRGKDVWITGAGTGYGRAMSIALALANANVFLTGRRAAKLEDTLEEARRHGARVQGCCVVPADICDPASVEAAASAIARRSTHLYGVVHSAALPQARTTPSPLAHTEPEQWNRLLATNVTGAWLVSRAALPLMLAGASLRMLLLTSEAGWASTPGVGPYNVSKSAVNALGASLAAECAHGHPDKDVQINVLDPGEARTEMNQGSTASPYAVVSMALLLLSHPAGGPNGRYFHRDGRHLAFGQARPYAISLQAGALPPRHIVRRAIARLARLR